MKAVRIHAADGPDHAVVEEVADLAANDESVLVEVRAAGVAFPDLLMTRGEYQIKPDPPFTLGSEAAGVVRAAPDGSGFAPGDRVAFLTLGAWADLAFAPPHMTFPLPDELSDEEGAALVINYHTALFALRDRAALQPGETLLIHGAAGGLGTAAIQVAKAFGARVLAVVSSDEKADGALTAGADEVIFFGPEWRDRAKELTGGAGVDAVFDPVGGDRFIDSLRALAEGGRLLVLGFAGGSIPEVKVNRLLLRNTSVVGVGWGGYVSTRPEVARDIGDTVNTYVRQGKIKPLIGASFEFEAAAEALRTIDERKAIGKVVLRVGE